MLMMVVIMMDSKQETNEWQTPDGCSWVAYTRHDSTEFIYPLILFLACYLRNQLPKFPSYFISFLNTVTAVTPVTQEICGGDISDISAELNYNSKLTRKQPHHTGKISDGAAQEHRAQVAFGQRHKELEEERPPCLLILKYYNLGVGIVL